MDWLRKAIGSDPVCSLDLDQCQSVSDVGILGCELYFPRSYVAQVDLEKYDNASSGKYTVGLGQSEMVFCDDSEDVCSLALTVTASLLENYSINENSIGYLVVGTETLVDKSKSVKTVLMDLFPNNRDIEGVDVKNACFGGTQALFHAIDWVQANYELEGKMAIVVCVDIAVYAPGPARCTGGAGAVAFLIGPRAPLVLERGLRSFYSSNVYDFYKPVAGKSTEYAIVSGSISVETYLNAVDATYEKFMEKAKQHLDKDFSLDDFFAVLFHSPFSRLTEKALARLAFIDFVKNHSSSELVEQEYLDKFRNLNRADTFSREFTAATLKSAEPLIAKKLRPYLEFCRRLGNMYTPSLYAQLINLIYRISNVDELHDERILLFSYGSGCIASMFLLKCNLKNKEQQKLFEIMRQSAKSAYERLDERQKCTPDQFLKALETREELITCGAPYLPSAPNINYSTHNNNDGQSLLVNHHSNTNNYEKTEAGFFPGTFYLTHIDENHQRFYSRVLGQT